MHKNAFFCHSQLGQRTGFTDEWTEKTADWPKKGCFATNFQFFFDEKKRRFVRYYLIKNPFDGKLVSILGCKPDYSHKHSKFTEACICYIQNSCYVCNEIINDSLLPRSFFISNPKFQSHLSNHSRTDKLTIVIFVKLKSQEKMKQIVIAPGKLVILLTVFSLTYFAGTAQNAPTNAINAGTATTQKLQAIAVNNSTVTISWQANTQVTANVDIELERSFDMVDFKTICYIMAPENAGFAAPVCGFKDKQAMQQSKTEAYYRLKQIDKAGNITYSDVVTVKLK